MHGIPTRPTFVNASGRNLRRLLHGRSPAERARVAAILTTEQWHLTRLLPAQSARLCKVGAARIGKALGSPPRHRSNAELDRLVARIGVGRLMDALDRATRPTAAAE